tara:strand:+ start:2085 stop:2546 length:462 start_codon:yes stop_codon:yes gene_type:complete
MSQLNQAQAKKVHIHINSRWFKDQDERAWRSLYGQICNRIFDNINTDGSSYSRTRNDYSVCGNSDPVGFSKKRRKVQSTSHTFNGLESTINAFEKDIAALREEIILYLLRDESGSIYTYDEIVENEAFGPVCEGCLEELKRFKNHRALFALAG